MRVVNLKIEVEGQRRVGFGKEENIKEYFVEDELDLIAKPTPKINVILKFSRKYKKETLDPF